MGNLMSRNRGGVQALPPQGVGYVSYPQQQPIVQQQPVVQQQAQPMFVQQPTPMYAQQAAAQVQQPQVIPSSGINPYRPSVPQGPIQGSPNLRPLYPSGPSMSHYPNSSPLSLPTGQNPSYYENDAFLANLTGWSVQDIERLRQEFLHYVNTYGVIDREGFRKLYIASLLNMTWQQVEHDAESAFRNFDINQTGFLDFNEYITACARMTREVNGSYGSQYPSAAPPPTGYGPSPSGSYGY